MQFCLMENIPNYKLTVGALTALSGLLAAACIFLGANAVDYNFEAFSEPTLILQYAHNRKQAYWFLLLDMVGYYLLLLPLVFYLHQQYKYHSPWVQLFTFSGAAYTLVGAIGAAVLTSAWPELMQQYLSASKEGQAAIMPLFATITHMVTKGLWNILEVLFAATWWIGFGLLLHRDNKFIGVLSIIAGVACLMDSIGTVLGSGLLSETGVNIYLLSGIIWPIALGIQLIRKSITQSAPYPSAAGSFTQKEEGHAEA
jgi:hypothetical protein